MNTYVHRIVDVLGREREREWMQHTAHCSVQLLPLHQQCPANRSWKSCGDVPQVTAWPLQKQNTKQNVQYFCIQGKNEVKLKVRQAKTVLQ